MTPFFAPTDGAITPGPTDFPMVCTQNPPGVTLSVTLNQKTRNSHGTSFQDITIEGKGFLPADPLSLVIYGTGETQTGTLRVNQLPTNGDGSFTFSNGMQLVEPAMNWQIYLNYPRGTACASFKTGP
jgi:hypothetical protein